MSSEEMSYWIAYDRISPIGQERGDYHAALISMTIANAFSNGKKTYTLEDFLLFKEEQEKTPEEVAAKVAAALGAPV